MPASITRSSLRTVPTSIATVSVGTPDTPLEDKLAAISTAWFQAIELGFPDLLSYASTHFSREIGESDYTALCTAAVEIRTLCKEHNLGIMMLQPFSNFEGWERGSKERNKAFARAKGWIRIMEALGTDMLQVGSSDSEGINGDMRMLAEDLGELADMLAEKGYRLAYENWCWATHAPTWKKVWEIVKLADRPNLGLCLDTFQTFGSEFADPTTSSGIMSTAPMPDLHTALQASLSELTATIPASKIYLLQISDAYRPNPPLAAKNDKDGLRPKGQWSHDYRPYPFNGGAYTRQCIDMARAVLATGAREKCYFSLEVFDGGPEGKEDREKDLEKFCKGAKGSLERLFDECANDKN